MKTFADFGIDITETRGTGEVKALCPQCSHLRKKSGAKCLNINVEAGLWNCWHCSWSGSLAHGADAREKAPRAQHRTYRKPDYHDTADAKRAAQWFARRGIPEEVLIRRKITVGKVYMPQVEEEVVAIQFPYFRNGECVNIKYRDKDKNFRMVQGAERILYGLDDIASPNLIWVEGECDVLALEVAGYQSVVSVPDGAPSPDATSFSQKFSFLDSAHEVLASITKHLLAVDTDAPGQALAEELARRLGPERCWRVQWPQNCKDANEVLVRDGMDALRRCIDAATPWPVRGIVTIAMLGLALDALYEMGIPRGVHPGWNTLEPYYRVAKGELTIVGGVPSHGKTRWLSHLLIKLAEQHNWSFVVFSPESKPERYVRLLIEQYVGKPFDARPGRMSQPEMWEAQAWLSEHICILAPDNAAPTIPEMLALARTQVMRMGISGVILDPWSWLSKPVQRNQLLTHYVAEQLIALKHFCTQYDCHLWLVAHPTKLQKAKSGEFAGMFAPPTAYDIADSAMFFNMADNVLCVWRNTDTGDRATSIITQKVKFEENGMLGTTVLIYDPATKRYYDPGTEPVARSGVYDH